MKNILTLLLLAISVAGFGQQDIVRGNDFFPLQRFNSPPLSGDPSTRLYNGSIYYNTSSHKFRGRANGVFYNLMTENNVTDFIVDSIFTIMDNANSGDTIATFPEENMVKYKGLIAGDAMKFVTTDSTITFKSSPLVFSQIATSSVGNTAASFSLLGTLAGANSVNGASIVAGTLIKLKGAGTIQVSAGGERDFTMEFRFSNFGIAPTISGLTAGSTQYYTYEANFIPRATGTNAAVTVNYIIHIGSTLFSGSFVNVMTTTGTLSADLKIDWNTADIANVATAHSNTLEIVRPY